MDEVTSVPTETAPAEQSDPMHTEISQRLAGAVAEDGTPLKNEDGKPKLSEESVKEIVSQIEAGEFTVILTKQKNRFACAKFSRLSFLENLDDEAGGILNDALTKEVTEYLHAKKIEQMLREIIGKGDNPVGAILDGSLAEALGKLFAGKLMEGIEMKDVGSGPDEDDEDGPEEEEEPGDEGEKE